LNRTTPDITGALVEGRNDNSFVVAATEGDYTVWLFAGDAEWEPLLFEVWAAIDKPRTCPGHLQVAGNHRVTRGKPLKGNSSSHPIRSTGRSLPSAGSSDRGDESSRPLPEPHA
jgi:hypothetical protein